jgi:uracil-DNA glycosylase
LIEQPGGHAARSRPADAHRTRLKAVADFRDSPQADGWRRLPFFQEGAADAVAARVDERIAAGAQVLPPPGDIFTGLRLAPLDTVKAVILARTPIPTPGDSHGLAFSYRGPRRLPASLRIILEELSADLGIPKPRTGDLSPWARQGVLCLNTALTVEAGQAGAHLKFGWSALADEAMAAISAERPASSSSSGAPPPASARCWSTARSTSSSKAATPPP